MAFTPAVARAIEELRAGHPGVTLETVEDGDGGARVIVERVVLGGTWREGTSWVGFRIPFTYPYADIYPHFVRGDLTRRDGGPLGEALSPTTFEGRPAIQVSRRSNRRDPSIETAHIKLLKVLAWLQDRS